MLRKFILTLLILSLHVCCPGSVFALEDYERAQLSATELLPNGGFENGVAGWVHSGGARGTSTTTPAFGRMKGTWDSSGAAQTFCNTTALTEGLKSNNGISSVWIQTPSGTATHKIRVTDGSNTLAENDIVSSTKWTQASTPAFVFPASGSVVTCLVSVAADEPSISIDGFSTDLYKTYEVPAGAQFIGSAYYETTASCGWARTNTAIGAFTADSDCPAPTSENWQGPGTLDTTDNNLPQFTVNDLPPGNYQVILSIPSSKDGTATTTVYRVSDGTNTYGNSHGQSAASQSGAATVVANFTYTSEGDRTFAVHGSSASGAVIINNDSANRRLHVSIYRYELSGSTAYTAATTAMSWSGYHDGDCSFGRSSTSYGDVNADSTCTFTERLNTNFGTVTSALSGSDKLPGIVFTPGRTGKVKVCAAPKISYGNAGATYFIRLTDGTTPFANASGYTSSGTGQQTPRICGDYQVTQASATTFKLQTAVSSGTTTITALSALTGDSSIDWDIEYIDVAKPAPLIKQAVVYDTVVRAGGVTGVTSIQSGTYTFTTTGILNVAASSFVSARFLRIGNTVSVWGTVNIDPTSSSPTQTNVGISLPVARTAGNFANSDGCSGIGNSINGSSVIQGGRVFATTGAQTCTYGFGANDSAARDHGFTFSYDLN